MASVEAEEQASTVDELQLVVFRLAGEEFGVEVTRVREIIRVPEVTRIPHAPDYVKGVINIRGEVTPVIDLRKRFSVGEGEAGNDARIIVVEVAEGRIGLQVDSVAEVLRIPVNLVDEPPASIAGLRSDYLTGVGRLENRLLILLDVQQIVSTAERIELQQVTEG